MIHRAKSSPTAHAAAQSFGAAFRTWALGALVLLLFLVFGAQVPRGSEPDCGQCTMPTSQSASGRGAGRE